MQQLDIPIITKTYELYRALHDLQKGIPKMERYSLWSRVEATALQMLEGFVHVGYLPCEQRAQKLARLAAEVDMLRMFIRLAVDIKHHPIPTNKIPSQGLDKNCCSRHSPTRSLNLREAATPPLIGTQRLWQFQRISPTDVTVGTALRCKEALAALSLPKVTRKVADQWKRLK